MQIKEVCILTGLSAKAIRLYESKGLVSVERAANAYREYTDEQIERAFGHPAFPYDRRFACRYPSVGGRLV